MAKKRILFSGYAPVHYLSFKPVYENLLKDDRYDVWLSGGFRRKHSDGSVSYDLSGFYDSFRVDPSRVISVQQTRTEEFDVLVCAHLSDHLFPGSVGKTVQIFHGVSFKNYAVREKALQFDILCLPGHYHASLYRERGLLSGLGPEVLITGFAKADALVDETISREQTLNGLGVDPGVPTILFAPTGDKFNALETMGSELIRRLSAEKKWNLLIKPHDHPKNAVNWFEELAEIAGDRVKIVASLDVVPLLHASDLLISDASSVITEFTLLDRPIVLINVPKLFKRVLRRGGALDLTTYGHKLGPVVADPAVIVDVVEAELGESTRFASVRQKMAEDVFYRPGSAAGRIKDVIDYAVGSDVPLPEEVIRLERRIPASA